MIRIHMACGDGEAELGWTTMVVAMDDGGLVAGVHRERRLLQGGPISVALYASPFSSSVSSSLHLLFSLTHTLTITCTATESKTSRSIFFLPLLTLFLPLGWRTPSQSHSHHHSASYSCYDDIQWSWNCLLQDSHSPTITCTYCCDEVKGTQDLKDLFSC